MKRPFLAVLVITALTIAAVWILSRPTVRLDPTRPEFASSPLSPLETTVSSVTVPIVIPIETVSNLLNDLIPPSFRGASRTEGTGRIEPKRDN